MELFKRIADRILPPIYRHPDPPVVAEESAPTMILSADDEARPSARLVQLGIDSVHAAVHEVALDDLAERAGVPARFCTWPGEHYGLLAGIFHVMQPLRAVEVRTSTGLSTLAMLGGLSAEGRLTTFSVRPWADYRATALTAADFGDGRVVQELADLADLASVERHRETLESADFILINGPADGDVETKIYHNLQTLGFRNSPILMVDGIRLWDMLRFWRNIRRPKFDLTSFGHWCGTGLIEL